MELVLGRSLAARIEERFPSLRGLVSIAAQIAHGLAAAHEKGIVHRDLKPDNVMITPEGLVKILDFGLAKRTSSTASTLSGSDAAAEAPPATEEGRLLGTVAYMSPEQARGLPLDFRSDQFAFGVILFEMLAGRRPFAGATTLDTLAAILHAEPAGMAEVETQLPAPLAWIVRRCLAKDPAARYAATRDLAQELDTIRDRMTDAGSLVGSGAIPAQGKRPRRRATLIAGIAGLAGIVGLLVVAGLRQARNLDDASVAQSAPTPATATALRRIAVLPFRDLSGTATGARIGEGFAETVSVRLAAASGLAVLPAAALDTSPGALGDPASSGFPQEVTRRTGVEAVLRGTLQFQGATVRASFSILDADGRQISAGQAEGPATQLLALQDEIAALAAAALGATVTNLASRRGPAGAALRGGPLSRGARAPATLRERSLGRRGDPHPRGARRLPAGRRSARPGLSRAVRAHAAARMGGESDRCEPLGHRRGFARGRGVRDSRPRAAAAREAARRDARARACRREPAQFGRSPLRARGGARSARTRERGRGCSPRRRRTPARLVGDAQSPRRLPGHQGAVRRVASHPARSDPPLT